MHESESCGCPEYRRLSRRQFMAATGGSAVALSLPAWLPRVALAQDYCSNRDIIVSIFLRGASDGLTMVPPFLDANYYAMRPTLNIPQPDSGSPFAAIDLDGQFGFAPTLAGLMPAYQAGHLLVVHATGSTDPSRSHFDAQRFMEVGKPADPSLFTGWLGRHLASAPPQKLNAPVRGIGIGYGLQRTLQGAPLSLPVPDLDTFGLSGSATSASARAAVIQSAYALVDDPLRAAAQNTQSTINLLNTINFSGYVPSGDAAYPAGSFGYAMKTTAALIKADIGVEAIAIDVAGWDTHNNQGSTTGTMATLMTALGNGLGAFHADMFAGNGRNVTVVVMSEFGRRPQENGSLGTDHGHGNVMFVMGPGIDGGRVLTQWPGLAPGQLFEGRDLQVTIDFRDVLAELVQTRLGNSNLGYVFPGFVPTFRGVTSTCPKGDLNCDGVVNGADTAAFTTAATDSAGYASAHPACNILGGDYTGDGAVNAADVPGFVQQVLLP